MAAFAVRAQAQTTPLYWCMGTSWPTGLPLLHETAPDFADSVWAAYRARTTVVEKYLGGAPNPYLDLRVKPPLPQIPQAAGFADQAGHHHRREGSAADNDGRTPGRCKVQAAAVCVLP